MTNFVYDCLCSSVVLSLAVGVPSISAVELQCFGPTIVTSRLPVIARECNLLDLRQFCCDKHLCPLFCTSSDRYQDNATTAHMLRYYDCV